MSNENAIQTSMEDIDEISTQKSVEPTDLYTQPLVDNLLSVAEKVKQVDEMIDKLLLVIEAIDDKLWEAYQNILYPETEEEDTKQSEVEKLLKQNKKLLEKLNNKYVLLVHYQEKPDLEGMVKFQVNVPAMHSYVCHKTKKYNENYQIFADHVSQDLYTRIQQELAACNFIIDWDSKRKSFRCESKYVPTVLGIFRNNIAAFKNNLEQ